MKQSIKTIIASLVLSFGICNLTFAQEMYASNRAIAAPESVAVTPAENKPASSIAETNFIHLFPNATAQKWNTTATNSFVSFLNNGRKATASFDAKGNMNYAITDCTIANLPSDFSKIIKNNYAHYKLFNAIEIKAHGSTAYQAVMENATGFVTLKYTMGGVEEIQRIKK